MRLASITLGTNDSDIINTLRGFVSASTYINPMRVEVDNLYENEDGFSLSLIKARDRCLKAHSQLDNTTRSLGPGVVIGLDTMAILDGVFLSTPLNEIAHRDLLIRLSNKTHYIMTSIYMVNLLDRNIISECTTTIVHMRDIVTLGVIDDYISTGEGLGRPGGYNINHRGISLISSIEGDHSNVIGIPLNTLGDLLTRLGFNIYH